MATAQEAKTRLFRIKFIHMVRRGLTAKEIGERLKVNHRTVHARAKAYGLTLAKAPRKSSLPFGLNEQDVDALGGDEIAEFEGDQ